ncbi:WD40-repeat-containing domain protein [Pavlovales sp. CCMP2436]|nr:WD40-repeat-containing domain protein [Pavlovales sp. CCMP2436]
MGLAKVALANLYAPAPSTTRGESTSLSATPKGDFLVYGAGKLVVIRSVANPIQATLYAQHQSAVTAVAVSPNGEWIASGDERGTVRVWANQPEQTLKLETLAFGGKVLDIAWSGDGQRLCAVGEGQQMFGKVFTWDSGNTVGAIENHSKRIITCAFKPTRPFRIATGSDDLCINWYEGPPFKYNTTMREHTRYPNCVRFSPDGTQLVSVGSDMKIVTYDSVSGAKVADISCDDMHTGAIFSCAWSPDSKLLLTASADKSVKLWSMGLGQPQHTILVAERPEVGDMQVGCCWSGPTVCSLSLSGRLNLIDPTTGKIVCSLIGHIKGITALAVNKGAEGATFATASFDGSVGVWDANAGTCAMVGGKGHANGIVALAFLSNGILASAALDRTVRFVPTQTGLYNDAATVELDGSVCGMSAVGELLAVVSEKSVYVLSQGSLKAQAEVGFRASSVAFSPSGAEVAVGGQEGEVATFAFAGGKLAKQGSTKRHQGEVTAMAYSPSGSHLGSCDAARGVFAWELPAFAPVSTSWSAHKAKVTALAWSPSGQLLVTGSVDSSVVLWSLEQPDENVVVRLAHADGVTAVGFLGEDLVLSAGQDACVKTWSISK